MELTASSPGTGRVSLAAGMALGAGVSFLDDTLPEAQAVTQPDMSPHEAAILPGASAARKPAFELLATFHLGGEEFALPAASVQEVVGYPENMATVPLGPPYLQGIFRVRNHIIPVIDLARLFDPSLSTGRQSGKVAIVHHDDLLIGLLFENTGEILRIRPDQHCPFRYG